MPTTEILNIFARDWWVLLLRGIFAVLFGVMALLWPGLTLVALVLLCGFYFILDGVMALFIGGHARAWPLLLAGVLGIAAGVLTFLYPGMTAFVLLVLFAAWTIVRGVFEIAAAIRLRKELRNEWLLIAAGVIAILFGLLLLMNPATGALALVWLIGIYALTFGALISALAFRLRRWQRRPAGAV
jgi:uncharacterized membrane protein HdeD (DUF308 family)